MLLGITEDSTASRHGSQVLGWCWAQCWIELLLCCCVVLLARQVLLPPSSPSTPSLPTLFLWLSYFHMSVVFQIVGNRKEVTGLPRIVTCSEFCSVHQGAACWVLLGSSLKVEDPQNLPNVEEESCIILVKIFLVDLKFQNIPGTHLAYSWWWVIAFWVVKSLALNFGFYFFFPLITCWARQ